MRDGCCVVVLALPCVQERTRAAMEDNDLEERRKVRYIQQSKGFG